MASQTNIEFTPIVFKGMRFIMSKTPNNKNIDTYIAKWKEFNVKHVVRCCLPSDADYDDKPLIENGIQRHDFGFPDGKNPSEEIIKEWFKVVESVYPGKTAIKGEVTEGTESIALHCVAGLGRTGVLIALALMSFGRMTSSEAVQLIREKRHGAINNTQLNFLRSYKPDSSCVIA